MTVIHVTPDDNIQSIIDRDGGPGVEIVFAPGSYRLNLRLNGHVPAHNGTAATPMILRAAEGHKATLSAKRSDDDPIHGFSTRHVVIDGFKINGPSDDTRQCLHFHGEPKKGTRPEGITIRNCRLLRRGGDAIKLSEVQGALIENNQIDGQYASKSAKESGIDSNKSNAVIVRDNEIFDHHMGMVFKGGGVDLLFEGNLVRARKGIEVGGHSGTGPVPGFSGNWAAKSAILRDNTLISRDATQYALRFIGAHDCEVDGNALDGDTVFSDSRQGGGLVYPCSNISVDGAQVVASVGFDTEEPADTSDDDGTPQEEDQPEVAEVVVEDTPPPQPAVIEDPNVFAYAAGKGGKDTIAPFHKGTSIVELQAFSLSLDGLQDYVTNKSASLIIIDLRRINGPRLTLKGKDIRPLAEGDVRLVG